MPSADQVPVISSHSRMRWHKWVVLTAGSTGSALRAVRPPNLHITPVARRDLVMPPARRDSCNARGRLGGYEPHIGPGDRLANGLGISGVILLPFDVGLYVGRWHQSHGVAKCLELTRPMVR